MNTKPITTFAIALLITSSSVSKPERSQAKTIESPQSVEAKSSPQIDCALYKAKYEKEVSAYNRKKISNDELVSSIQAKQYELGDVDAVQGWYENSKELKTHLENEAAADNAADEVDTAIRGVLRHLGYTDEKLKELWDWRSGRGALWKKSFKDIPQIDAKVWKMVSEISQASKEARSFCSGLGVEISR